MSEYRINFCSTWNTSIELATKRFKIENLMLRNQPRYGMLFTILSLVEYKLLVNQIEIISQSSNHKLDHSCISSKEF